MNLQAKADKFFLNSIYIHVPFCASTCDFCAFYQQKPHRKDLDRYLQGIKEDFAQRLPKGPVKTVFMGGGTPGLLPAKDLQFIASELMNYIQKVPEEWTVEMAPSTVKMDKLLAMRDFGVNRISMGVQSFDENRLKSLGRLHSPKQVYQAYECIRKAGFDNVNLDLMFAIPDQDMEGWEADLNEAIRLGPEHISTYCLTFEEDTALYIKLSEGKVKIDEERERAMYLKTWEILEKNGYSQYEISNFSRKGYECKHNLDTWKMKDWLGFGPSAASQFQGIRYANPFSQTEWLLGVESNAPKRVDEEILSADILAADSLIFGLRMNQGVNLEKWKTTYSNVDLKRYSVLFDDLIKEGLCEYNGEFFGATLAGRLLIDSIAELFL